MSRILSIVNGYLIVVEDQPIEEGDYILWYEQFIEKVEKIGIDYFVTSGGVRNPELKTTKKIVAHLPLAKAKKLKDVPLLKLKNVKNVIHIN